MRASISFRQAAAVCLAAVLLTLAGCGTAPPQAEVEGKVTLGSTPLCGAIVTFYPVSEGARQPPYSRGKTDDTGKYTLATVDGSPGALVGQHRVVVDWPPRERGSDQAKRPPGPPIPLQYTVASDTPLVIEVKPGGRQTIDLHLQR
jgi:hypothetical protein